MDFAKLNRKLEGLMKASCKGQKGKNLHEIMRCPEIWQIAYANIYGNKGSMTAGVDNITLDGMSTERFSKLINDIKSGKYIPKPVRRVYTPKKSGDSRTLGVPSSDDKLVQGVIKILLEQIYEPIFHESSHGFRPNKSCHTALMNIRYGWKGMKWFVDFDIKGCFDNIDHEILIELLERRIEDKRFIGLVKAILKAGYLEDWKYNQTYSGTPQGGIVSPLLSNIYLHELDVFMSKTIKRFDTGKRRPANPEYASVTKQILKLRKRMSSGEVTRAEKEELKELQELQKKLPQAIQDTEAYKRLRYCRYADDFICGVIGSYKDATAVMQTVTDFLQNNLKLEVSPDKTKIVRSTKGSEFIGYHAKVRWGNRLRKIKTGKQYHLKRTTSGVVQLSVPKHKIREFCREKGYGDLQLMKSVHRGKLLTCSELEIVTAFNAELRGFANYYSLARDVKQELNSMCYLARMSLIKTLASRNKTSITKVYSKLKVHNGYSLKYKVNGKHHTAKIFRLNDLSKATVATDEKPSTEHLYRQGSELSRRMEARKCEFCGSTDRPVEVHHIRKLKDLKRKRHLENWEKIMIARNRKTLILCAGSTESCHYLLHKGKLPDMR